jgi:hypothetical protein
VVAFAAFLPACAFLGAFAAIDTYFPVWRGTLIGGTLGLFFGLAFGGALPRSVADWGFEPDQPEGDSTMGTSGFSSARSRRRR